jgi:hypothetical protein
MTGRGAIPFGLKSYGVLHGVMILQYNEPITFGKNGTFAQLSPIGFDLTEDGPFQIDLQFAQAAFMPINPVIQFFVQAVHRAFLAFGRFAQGNQIGFNPAKNPAYIIIANWHAFLNF